ncbi:MAG: hypothetical protein ACR2LF_01040 [Jatrophihabitantaceae bacterium]
MVKLVLIGLVGAFLLFYIMTSPDQAANIAHGIWHDAVGLAHGLGRFVNKISS